MSVDLSKIPELQAYFAKGFWSCDCTGYRLRRPDLLECPTCHKTRPCGQSDAPKQTSAATRHAPRSCMSKTEAEYARTHLSGIPYKYEGVTFRMSNGHRYTPDFVWWEVDKMVCVEIKGSYRLGSYQRSRLAFDQCKAEFTSVSFRWCERKTNGEFCVR